MIVSLDGKPITSADQLGAAIQADKPGQTVTIGLYRGQSQLTVTATLGSTSEEPQSRELSRPGRLDARPGRRRLYARMIRESLPPAAREESRPDRIGGAGDGPAPGDRRMAAPRVEPDRDGSPPDERDPGPDPRRGHHRPRPRRAPAVALRRGHGGRQGPDGGRPGGGRASLQGPRSPRAVVAKMRGKAFAAPCTVAVIAAPRPSNVPVWEQVASASCTGYAMVLAATALGLGRCGRARRCSTPSRCAGCSACGRRAAARLGQRRLTFVAPQETTAGTPSSRCADHRHRRTDDSPPSPGTVAPSPGRSMTDEQAHRTEVGRLAAQFAVAVVPATTGQIARSTGRPKRSSTRPVDEAPRRLGPSDVGIEECLGASVEGLGEPVDAIEGDRDGEDRPSAGPCSRRGREWSGTGHASASRSSGA